MYKSLTVEIVGTAPLIMHNGQTADPLNRYSKQLKEISGKRKKTDEDYSQMAKIEYIAGLYLDEGEPVLPSRLLEAAITDGARKSKLGKLALAGVTVEKHAPLRYDGPRTPTELFADERFRLSVPVRIGQTKVIRTRPIFHHWSAEIEVSYLADVMGPRDLMTAIKSAGALSGLGDWRPRYGRFGLAEEVQLAKAA